MLINKFSATRIKANTPATLKKTARAASVAAVVALADATLAKAARQRTAKPPADSDKIEKFEPGSLGSILRARAAKRM